MKCKQGIRAGVVSQPEQDSENFHGLKSSNLFRANQKIRRKSVRPWLIGFFHISCDFAPFDNPIAFPTCAQVTVFRLVSGISRSFFRNYLNSVLYLRDILMIGYWIKYVLFVKLSSQIWSLSHVFFCGQIIISHPYCWGFLLFSSSWTVFPRTFLFPRRVSRGAAEDFSIQQAVFQGPSWILDWTDKWNVLHLHYHHCWGEVGSFFWLNCKPNNKIILI